MVQGRNVDVQITETENSLPSGTSLKGREPGLVLFVFLTQQWTRGYYDPLRTRFLKSPTLDPGTILTKVELGSIVG